MSLRPQPGHTNKQGINPITNTPIQYAQKPPQQPYYQQSYPQPPQQYTQNPQQYQNPYYNQKLPQTIQQPIPDTKQVVQQASMDAIELDHMNGFSGRYPDVIHFHPQREDTVIYALAGLIVIENFNDKHQQVFLRAHDMDISALCVSRSGRFIASGQIGTKNAKTPEAPIILWDFQSRKPIQVLKGLKDAITNISFSEDDKFIAATSAANQMMIWNCQDYTVVHNKVLEVPINLITWCPPRRSSAKHSQYLIVTSQGSNIFLNVMDFDVASMQYVLKQAPCQLPSTGLVRNYTKAVIDQNGDYLYVGTHAGEVCIFSISSTQGGVFKAAIPVSNNGVLSLILCGNWLLMGAGDGKLKKLSGSDTRWNLSGELCLEGRLSSMSVNPTGNELLVGGSGGRIHRVACSSLDCTIHSEGHLSSVVGLSVAQNSNDIFVTIDIEGVVVVWDMNEMLVITRCVPVSMNRIKGSAVYMDPDRSVVSGWKDGFIRCYVITNNPISPLKWEVANAHKGSVTQLYSDSNYYLSGGEDSIIRIWSRSTRQLITQIALHSKEITKVFPDLMKPNLIHSCSADKTIHTFDMKTDKKVIQHQSKNGILLDMTQRKDNELELITCGVNMPVQFWDIDIMEPVGSIEASKLNCIQISPDGRMLAAGADTGELVLMSVVTMSVVGRYLGHSQGVSRVAWTSDQKQVITTSYDGSICLWNIYL